MSAERVDQHLRRFGALKAERNRHEHVWRQCFDHTYPELGDGLGGNTLTDASTAQTKKAELLDSTGTDAARLLASSIMSGMTPANQVWFAMDVGDETDEERRWLDHAAERCWEEIHGSNYDAAKFEGLLQIVNAGWCVLFIDEAERKLQFELWPLGQCYLGQTRSGGPVDILYRCFQLTAEQAVAAYGEDKLSDKVREDAAKNPDAKHEFVLCIAPRKVYAAGSRMPQQLPYESLHIEVNGKREVRESGYHEQPFVAPRWTVLPGSPYALSLIHI